MVRQEGSTSYRLVNEQIWKYYGYDKKVDEAVKATWRGLHDRLSMEFGVKELSPVWYSYTADWMGKPHMYSGSYEWNTVVESWLNLNFADNLDPDMFVKQRLSFIELAFREREHQLSAINAMLPNTLRSAAFQDAAPRRGLTIPGVNPKTHVERALEQNTLVNDTFVLQVHELNTRFEQAGVPLHYHNGFIQITQDALLQARVEQPFWDLVKDPRWKNVDIDMKEAIDRRDTGGRDPSFYAAKALESTIKIISDEKGWTRGTRDWCWWVSEQPDQQGKRLVHRTLGARVHAALLQRRTERPRAWPGVCTDACVHRRADRLQHRVLHVAGQELDNPFVGIETIHWTASDAREESKDIELTR